jgi:TolB-like protein/DNA-binding SARP family transcriptional activator/Tfp pilus assembly protein PilF
MDTASAQVKGTEESARWSLRLFGGFESRVLPGGEKVPVPGKRERVLLAYLAVSPKGSQVRRKLATLLWGDARDETALDNLRTCVFNLRKALGDTEHRIISSEGRDIVLDAAAFEVDVLAFRAFAAQSGMAELEAAANLYSGEFLDALSIDSEEFESWRREEATRCRDQALDVLTRLMTQSAQSGETERAIEAGLRILRLEPLHEAAARQLMRLYGASGRRGAAAQLYRALAEALRTELNAQPEAETRALFAEIARGSEVSTPTADAALAHRATTTYQSDPPRPPPRPNFRLRAALPIFAGALIIAAALASYPRLALFGTSPALVVEQPVSASQTSTISIAVLPFTNMSGDASQDFFSDGMTEELTTALARISELRVVARTSAYQFKGENADIRAVGQALGATHLLEGSVRRAGLRLRIAAQLIRADDGTHLWSQTYERELSDVFATQEEIARAIAEALQIPLGLKPGQHLVSSRSIDPQSYEQFLRARPLVRLRDRGVPEAIEILEPVVARNPDYAPALALLASAYAYVELDVQTGIRESWPKAEAAARRAIELDPNLADAYFALGRLERVRGNLVEADDLLAKALALDPNDTDALDLYMLHLSNMGRLKEALAIAQRLRALEPFVPTFTADVGRIQWENGQTAAAIETMKSVIETGTVRLHLAMMYAALGRFGEGADMLEAGSAHAREPQAKALALQAAAILRSAPNKATTSQGLPRSIAAGLPIDFIYLHAGAPERALEQYQDVIDAGRVGGAGGTIGFLWHPSYAPVRKTERFKAFVRDAGMVEYWRAKGWPEFCRPISGDDFICK